MKNKVVFIILITFFCFIGGLILGVCLSQWSVIKPIFFEFKLFQIIQLITTIILAIVATIFIHNRLNINKTKSDIINEISKQFHTLTMEIYENGNNYMSAPTKDKENKINFLFKSASMSLFLLEQVTPNKKNQYEACSDLEIYAAFSKFKNSLTDTPFGLRKPIFSTKNKENIDNSYRSLIRIIIQFRIDCIG
jgi:hypothetical protein